MWEDSPAVATLGAMNDVESLSISLDIVGKLGEEGHYGSEDRSPLGACCCK